MLVTLVTCKTLEERPTEPKLSLDAPGVPASLLKYVERNHMTDQARVG